MTTESKLPWGVLNCREYADSDESCGYQDYALVPLDQAHELHDMREHTVKRLMEVIDVQEKRLAQFEEAANLIIKSREMWRDARYNTVDEKMVFEDGIAKLRAALSAKAKGDV